MKTLLLTIQCLLCTAVISTAQPTLCEALRIKATKYDYDGRQHISVQSAIADSVYGQSAVTKFIRQHKLRFDYLIVNKVDSLQSYSLLYPDSAAVDRRFCTYLSANKKFGAYVAALLPRNIDTRPSPALIFSRQELMLVASRFFLCDRITHEDTAIHTHICVGINGVKELAGKKDYTVLAAFCFEAIFHSLKVSEDDPDFLTDFSKSVERNAHAAFSQFQDFDSYLLAVRNATFKDMENDRALESMLLAYFKANAGGLGFKIQ